MLAETTEAEIAALAAQYGPPRRVQAALANAQFEPLIMDDRYGEVCMVVRRPSGALITAIKTFYPPGAFRLLTGGIHHGEPIADALARELAEETGLDVAVRRFLAVIEYALPDAGRHPFATFAFLVDELGGMLAVSDPDERVAAFRDLAPAELPALADTLDAMPAAFSADIRGSWADWGRFRAVTHRVVYEALR